jgi:hypothetical protein
LLTTPVPAGANPTDPVPAARPPGSATPVLVSDLIDCPSLQQVLRLAKAEWP